MEDRELKIVGFTVENPQITTEEGTIEGPTAYYMTVESLPRKEIVQVEIPSETWMNLNNLLGE